MSQELICYDIALEDQLMLNPLEGRKKNFNLLRTKIHFFSESLEREHQFPIKLPHLEGESFDCSMIYDSACQNYYFQTNNSNAFKYNGGLAFKVYLKHGDTINLGGNLLFFKKNSLIQEQEDYFISPQVFRSELPLHLEGETGTGKTFCAQRVHQLSGKAGSFVHLNLSSFSPGLIESELFGHVQGAFTGADRTKMGAIEEAQRGTLFLDEIDSLSLELQVKLLLFLDNQSFRPVGASREKKVDLRLITASGQNLERLVEQGKMRKDFYFRLLSGHKIELEPLRQNTNLIRKHCWLFCEKYNLRISRELIDFYCSYSWPGNLRQLYSHLEKKRQLENRSYLRYADEDQGLFRCNILTKQNETQKSLEQMKKDYVRHIYYRCDQNKSHAAKILEIHPKTVEKFLDRVQI